jgi:hypothetical protein
VSLKAVSNFENIFCEFLSEWFYSSSLIRALRYRLKKKPIVEYLLAP